jgi:hypothetical protein
MNDQQNPIDLGAVISRLAPDAIDDQIEEYKDYNQRALDCLHLPHVSQDERVDEIKDGWTTTRS